jgi:hypothetical protein
MRSLLYVLTGLGFLGLGFWAYQENYATQAQLKEVRELNRQIGEAHARINMLNAEWAYLNRPDRLRDLVNLNFERLALVPLMAEAFASVDQVAMPLPDYIPLIDPTEISSDGALSALNGEEPL